MIGILRSAFILVAAIAIVGGGTYAYFSTTDESINNTIATGTLSIDLQNQNTTNPFIFNVTNLLPGGTALVNFDVQNDSTTAIQLRGAAFGAWDNAGSTITSPVNTLVSVVRVERWNGSGWVTLLGDGTTPITGMFYDSPTGADLNLFTVPASGKDQFQLTVKLDPNTGDDYQGEVYKASVKVQARQDGATSWPANLNTGF